MYTSKYELRLPLSCRLEPLDERRRSLGVAKLDRSGRVAGPRAQGSEAS